MKTKRLFLAFVTIAVIMLSACEKEDDVTLVSIEVTSQPTKKTYLVDEIFDSEGMVVVATYSDESTTPITVNADDFIYDFSMAGTDKFVTITVTYEGKTATTTVTDIVVINPAIELMVTVLGEYIYNGTPIEPLSENVIVKYGNITLNADDYILLYSNNLFDGNATVMVIGTGNYAVCSGTGFFTILPFVGSGTSDNPYEINSIAQLARLATLVNTGKVDYKDTYFEQTCDIDLSNSSKWNNRRGWIPIGSGINNFKGHYDGKKHTISNLYINDRSLSDAGLFGVISGGTVRNLGIVDCDITANSVGGVVGLTYGSVINCYSTGEIKGDHYVGGIAGRLSYGNSSIANCYSTAEVSSSYYVGGVAGVVYGGSIINCYATGAIICNNYYVGGLAGTVENGGNLKNCVALNPSLSCQNFYLGRIAGQHGNLFNNVAWDNMLVNGSVVISSDDSSLDGADITKAAIAADGSIGGRFTINDGWTIENGKLPGLDTAVDLPEHLK